MSDLRWCILIENITIRVEGSTTISDRVGWMDMSDHYYRYKYPEIPAS